MNYYTYSGRLKYDVLAEKFSTTAQRIRQEEYDFFEHNGTMKDGHQVDTAFEWIEWVFMGNQSSSYREAG